MRASLNQFCTEYNGELLTGLAKPYIINAKNIPDGGFVLRPIIRNRGLDSKTSIGVKMDSALATLRGKQRIIYTDAKSSLVLGFQDGGEHSPNWLGVIGFASMNDMHKAGRIKQETGYDPNGLIVIQMQGADLAKIQDEQVREQTRQVQNAIDWDKFLLEVFLNEWAEGVEIERAYYLPASQHSWAHKADTEEKRKTMRRHYDDLAEKTGFIFNEALGVYEKTLANPE